MWYVDILSNSASIKEHFLEYVNVAFSTSESLTKVILHTLDMFGLPTAKCIDQGYKNESNMAGKQSGVQKRILDINP